MNTLIRISVLSTAVCAALTLIGCKSFSERGAKGLGLLPKPADAGQKLASYQPKNPYNQLVPGLLSRKLYETAGPRGTLLEVNDLLVGPRQHSGGATLNGTAVVEVKSGEGLVRLDGNEQKLQLGTTFTIPQGASVVFENDTESPLAMQVHLIRAE
jgi:hypothetical protein